MSHCFLYAFWMGLWILDIFDRYHKVDKPVKLAMLDDVAGVDRAISDDSYMDAFRANCFKCGYRVLEGGDKMKIVLLKRGVRFQEFGKFFFARQFAIDFADG